MLSSQYLQIFNMAFLSLGNDLIGLRNFQYLNLIANTEFNHAI